MLILFRITVVLLLLANLFGLVMVYDKAELAVFKASQVLNHVDAYEFYK